MAKIRILIADDHELVREGIKKLVETEKDLECVALAGDGEEAIKLAKQLLPDVAIVDIAMPKKDGIEAAKEIKESCPSTKVIIISAYDYNRYVIASIKAGVDGYLLKKNLPADGLVNSIRLVTIGEKVFASEIASGFIEKLASIPNKNIVTFGHLSNREMEILRLAAKGMSTNNIASKLVISKQTVSTHFANIYKKMGVESRFEAVLYALKKGWVTVDEPDLDKVKDL